MRKRWTIVGAYIRDSFKVYYSGTFTKSEFQLRAAAAAARGPETDSFRAFEETGNPKTISRFSILLLLYIYVLYYIILYYSLSLTARCLAHHLAAEYQHWTLTTYRLVRTDIAFPDLKITLIII